jgi:hypothetical protein
VLREQRISRLISAGALLTAMLIPPAAKLRAQTGWYEGFEAADTSWLPAGGNVRYEIRTHQRIRGQARTGDSCERIEIVGHGGTRAYLSHDIARARVIDELAVSVQVKSDRPGIQVFARVVLPRTTDPRTGDPLTALIAGSSYSSVGRWQQLWVEDLPTRLRRQTYVLRAQLGPDVDEREAYVDRVFLNVYGGPGVTTVWIDDLDVAGHIPAPSATAGRRESRPGINSASQSPGTQAGWRHHESESGGLARPDEDRVVLMNSVLVCGQRPVFPRIVRHQGEPLETLAQLGFNTVWLNRLPSTGTLEEARRSGLWLICPPPRPSEAALAGNAAALAPLGSAFDRVLAWDMGSGLTQDQLPTTRRWAELVRAADRQTARPLVCRPSSQLRAYSRMAEGSMIILIGRDVVGTSLELADYGKWLRERPRLARPGTPWWTTVETQLAPSLREQLAALNSGSPPPTTLPPSQMRLAVYTAISSGARGLVFESRSSLDGADSETRRRRTVLELLNRELHLAEPWLAAGEFVDVVEGNEPGVVASVLQTKRARLLTAMSSAAGSQLVPGEPAADQISFVVPGVPEEYRCFLLSPGIMRPLRRTRQTGGVRVTLDDFSLTSLILLTGDPVLIGRLTRESANLSQRAAELQRELSAMELNRARHVASQMRPGDGNAGSSSHWLTSAQKKLQWADGSFAGKDFGSSYLHAQQALSPLRLLQRWHWQAAVGALSSPVASPATVLFDTLPWHERLRRRLASSKFGPNRLAGGDFEDLEALLRAGWNYSPGAPAGIHPVADMAEVAAHSGKYGLRLAARANDDQARSAVLETPPIWMTSPAVPVESGTLVAIHGWVQIPTPITGGVDGLLIIDSLAGEPLAERIHQTQGWQEFLLYRTAPRSGRMTLTFVLSGLGEAWIDDVTIQSTESRPIQAAQRSPPRRPWRLPPTAVTSRR